MSAASLLGILGQWAPLLVVVIPLLLASLLALPRLAGLVGVLSPWAILPALLAGLSAPATELLLPELLLGSSLMIDPIGRPFLVLLALLWLAAGWLAGVRLRRRGPGLLFLLAMSGSFGLAVAGNLVVLLLASTVSGYAVYGLAVRQPGARAFVVLLVLSDLLLFELLLLLLKGDVGLSLMPAASASSAIGASTLLLLLTLLGFGAKAAVFGLHAWLPRMLSGKAVELSPVLIGFVLGAGLLPWLRLLPPGALSGSAAALLSWIALAGTALAVVLGLFQRGQRAVLGYAITALGGFWLMLAPETEAHALALGQAGLALAVLLVQGARCWVQRSWLDWLLHGFGVLILADAVLGMAGGLSSDASNGLMIAGAGLFGLLIGRLLWARQNDQAVALAIGPGVPIYLSLGAATWALLNPGSLMAEPIAASVLIAAAISCLLLEPLLMRLPRVPPGDLLAGAARLFRQRF